MAARRRAPRERKTHTTPPPTARPARASRADGRIESWIRKFAARRAIPCRKTAKFCRRSTACNARRGLHPWRKIDGNSKHRRNKIEQRRICTFARAEGRGGGRERGGGTPSGRRARELSRARVSGTQQRPLQRARAPRARARLSVRDGVASGGRARCVEGAADVSLRASYLPARRRGPAGGARDTVPCPLRGGRTAAAASAAPCTARRRGGGWGARAWPTRDAPAPPPHGGAATDPDPLVTDQGRPAGVSPA